ncbi:pentapeptide repeat-containing protein [Paracoccus simplex]|uniref:Pentapeptide repeat-containing protein n=1 Tax=Paracoccus simplex TaxID=2086346 RepID=A0ABV7RZV4_9RHOB
MAEFTRAEIVRRIATMGSLHLAGSDLTGLDLSGMTLVGADLSYADLTEADLTNAQLSGASLWSVRAVGARFHKANLAGASLGLADLTGADLRDAVLERADLTGARLRGAWLDAMQRALAISAPPLRYPDQRERATTCILHEGHLATLVSLRCGDRLEMHLQTPPDAPARPEIVARLEGEPILSGPEPCEPSSEAIRILTFLAVAPGRARLVLVRGDDRPPVSVELLVVP